MTEHNCEFCGRDISDRPSHHFACLKCFWRSRNPSPRARLEQLPGQLSLLDDLAEPEPEFSEFISWLDERGAAA